MTHIKDHPSPQERGLKYDGELFVGICSFFALHLVHALIAVPRASPLACKHVRPRWKGQKEKKSLQIERGAFSGWEGSVKKYKILLSLQSRQGVA